MFIDIMFNLLISFRPYSNDILCENTKTLVITKVFINEGDATIRTKYQIRTKVEFGPKSNSDLILKLGPEF